MKKVFYGLAVAVVALSASAFTNAQSNGKFAETYYVTGQTQITNPNDAYTFNQDEVTCPGSGSIVCQFTSGSTLTSPQLKTTVEAQSAIVRRPSL